MERELWASDIDEFDFWNDEMYFGRWGAGGMGKMGGDGGRRDSDEGECFVRRKERIGEGGWMEMGRLVGWWWGWWGAWAMGVGRRVWTWVIRVIEVTGMLEEEVAGL